MAAPLTISVVTAVFNARETISSALASVAEQTWPAVEHVVIDGASTDGTLEVLRAGLEARGETLADRDRYACGRFRLPTNCLRTHQPTLSPLHQCLRRPAWCADDAHHLFNENEAVVCRPEEALDFFLLTEMDVMVMGLWMVSIWSEA